MNNKLAYLVTNFIHDAKRCIQAKYQTMANAEDAKNIDVNFIRDIEEYINQDLQAFKERVMELMLNRQKDLEALDIDQPQYEAGYRNAIKDLKQILEGEE